ncbi:hypothetical protein LCGC14_1877320 [marine sediment metagenome]|uniref:Portal protein n=1 Tax=marine sediment metagenome TaxID=412755 RepID=A0A0F9G378_9ZZZZ
MARKKAVKKSGSPVAKKSGSPVAKKPSSHMVKVRVLKADGTREPDVFPSQQIEPDKFKGMYGTSLVMPPYNFQQLSSLSEMHPVHGAALEQKAADILGQGPHWESITPEASEEQHAALEAWLHGLEREATLSEALSAVLQDYETFGWGILEVLRDVNNVVRGLVHAPAQTVRAHIDRKRLVQVVNERRVWFRRWGAYDDKSDPILSASGNRAPPSTGHEKLANDMLVFRKTSRRSAVYGVPGYVSAIGHIAMSLAARDYNVAFFGNAREPRFMFIAEGPDEEEVDACLDQLEEALSTQHGEPHRNLLVGAIGGVKITVEKMTAVGNDEHFTRLTETSDGKILIAHRIPADRLGAAAKGALGGSVTREVSEVYRDAVVAPTQQMIVDRLNKFILKEFRMPDSAAGSSSLELEWRLALDPLDLSSEPEDVKTTTEMIKADLITLNEGRERLGYVTKGEEFDVTWSVYLKTQGLAPEAVAASRAGLTDAMHERLDDIDGLLHRVTTRLDLEEAAIEDLEAGASSAEEQGGHNDASASS